MMHLNLSWEPKAISVNDSTAGFHCVKMLPMITMILAVRLFQKKGTKSKIITEAESCSQMQRSLVKCV